MNIIHFLKKKITCIAVIIVISVFFFNIMNVRYWKKSHGVIFWDTLSYYAYLPSAFIYHDLSLKFIDRDAKYFSDKMWPEHLPGGKYGIKTTMGLAVLYSPFFGIAHIYATLSDKYPADGYSLPYHIALEFSSLFYLIFGLLVLRKILLLYFKETIATITILSIGLATNLFEYTTQSATMPHSFDFTLIVFFLWCIIKWYEKPKILYAVLLGLLAGLISLIRPTNAIVVLLFLFYDFSSFRNRFQTLIRHKWLVLVMIFLAFLVWVPQLLYWKSISGEWFLFSYGSDEGFFWTQPVIGRVLFGFRKGWLIYTPLMIFAAAGLFLLRKKAREWKLALPLTIITAIYIVSSWWCWWYGGSFGMRPMIDYYGLMAIGLGAFLSAVGDLSRIKRYALSVAFSLSLLLGIVHHIQFYYGAIHYDSMTFKAYIHSIGKISSSPEMEKYLDPPDYEKAKTERP